MLPFASGKISETASNATKQRERFFFRRDSDTVNGSTWMRNKTERISGFKIPLGSNKTLDQPDQKRIRKIHRKQDARDKIGTQ